MQGLTKPALFYPSKRNTHTTNQPRVRPYHPHLERLRDAPHASHVPTEKVARQPNVGVIGHRNDFFLGVKLDEGSNRAKRFFVREEGGGGDVGEDSRGIEGAGAFGLGSVGGVTPDKDVGAHGDSVVHVPNDFGDGAVVDERAVCPVVRVRHIYISWSRLSAETYVVSSSPFPILNAATFSASREAKSA